MAKTNESKYAVVGISGKQYRVHENEEFLVDKLFDPKKPDVKVLLVVDGEKVKVGKPEVKDAKVELEIVEAQQKADKIRVFKYKSKSRYRKRAGFRALMTKLRVKKIA